MHDVDEALAKLEALVPHNGNALFAVRQADNRCAVLFDQRQDGLDAVELAGDRVDEGLALVDAQARFERFDDGRVDADRQIARLLRHRHSLRHQGGLVGEWHTHIDVEDMRATGDLLLNINQNLR